MKAVPVVSSFEIVVVNVFFVPTRNRSAVLFTFFRYGDIAVTERLPLVSLAAS
jgi:hypothetical protein